MRILGINAVFHDTAAALVVDGEIVFAAEEERFSRRKHGKRPVPYATWELPDLAIKHALAAAGLTPADLDLVGYSYDPRLVLPSSELDLGDPDDAIRTRYAERAPEAIATALPGLDPAKVRFVPHHVAHAASAALASPQAARDGGCSVLTVDGRGERISSLAGRYRGGRLEVLHETGLPQSLGFVYEDLTRHLGFTHSSDEYKVMALASYGKPRFADEIAEFVHATGDGGFVAKVPDFSRWAPPLADGESWDPRQDSGQADLAASVQEVLERTLVDVATWLHGRTGDRVLAMAGGTALNCVANSRIWRESPFEEVYVQPAAGDSGTALGAALQLSADAGEIVAPMESAALGRSWTDEELAQWLTTARLNFTTPDDLAGEVADVLAADGVVAWFDGRAEFGPRALGHRSLMAHPGKKENLERLNDVKGREQFRPVAPMVLAERAEGIFSGGPIPSEYMLFVHDVAEEWKDRIPAVVHVDGTARIQTIHDDRTPHVAALLRAFEERTGLPVVVNTSLNTAGRPMVDDPRDAMELFGSAPVDVLVLGPHLVRRSDFTKP
ncbi:carbamoyltransferase family protein [Kineococcus sp. SYSU DK001]|uniref:carbamoyltransferase family protein n=1 Tax=Kineococcus sp. SYSU DK001 TaxID=3383122 RepID=UPI003D7E0EC3